ncbi:MAG: GGDEF domain-containing protein [Oscillibacter sp.]
MRVKEHMDVYGKFSVKIKQINLIAAVAVLILEVCIYFVLNWQGLISQPLHNYIIRFLVIPTMLDALILVGGEIATQKVPREDPFFPYISIIQTSCLCFAIAATHYVYSVTLCLFCFPIFITVLFGDRKMSRRISELNLLLLLLTLCLRYLLGNEVDDYLLTEGVVSVMIIAAAGLVSRILIDSEAEKNAAIELAHQKQVEMQEQLNRDQKTGLYGSAALRSALHNAVSENGLRPVVLALLDIDDFKSINDSYGHAAGDKVIVRLSELMLEERREDVFPSRFGGDEFAVILRMEMPKARMWLDELRGRFALQQYEEITQAITISVGMAAWDRVETEHEFFTHADAAMYASKQLGKNRITAYFPESGKESANSVSPLSSVTGL